MSISLGINFNREHDSSACIARDGKIEFAIAEERLTRIKHDKAFPKKAIQACLDYLGITPDKINYVRFAWSPPGRTQCRDLITFLNFKRKFKLSNIGSLVLGFLRERRRKGGVRELSSLLGPLKAKIEFVDHHYAHAISAYAFSGFDESTVAVVDGRGADEATSIWHAKKGKLEHVLTIPWPNSLGLFYAEMTYFLGFKKYSDEWKVMGLAAYGREGSNLSEFIKPNNNPYWINSRALLGMGAEDVAAIEVKFGKKRKPDSAISQKVKDIAFAVQDNCEKAMFSVVKKAIKKTGCRNLCLAGGVALNSKANGKIISLGMADKIFVQPAAGDDGAALGAALEPFMSINHLPVVKMENTYLGLEYSGETIEAVLSKYKIKYKRINNPSKAAAALIAKGKIISWFQGRAEFGPRALGNRSILADPRDPKMKDLVNSVIKFREGWRPFAPSVLAEDADEYFEKMYESPFMVLTFQVKEEKRKIIPAVTHVDGSARPQTVTKEANQKYWELINEFKKITGVPVVMNTSFNLRGEPMVCSPADAIRTFYSSGIEAMIMEDFLIEK